MVEYFQNLHPISQAFIATSFTWGVTAIGAALVFPSRNVNMKALDGMLGFAAGVMIAASYWSLLAPAIEMSEGRGIPVALPPSTRTHLVGVVLTGLAWPLVWRWQEGSGCKPFPKGWPYRCPSGVKECQICKAAGMLRCPLRAGGC